MRSAQLFGIWAGCLRRTARIGKRPEPEHNGTNGTESSDIRAVGPDRKGPGLALTCQTRKPSCKNSKKRCPKQNSGTIPTRLNR